MGPPQHQSRSSLVQEEPQHQSRSSLVQEEPQPPQHQRRSSLVQEDPQLPQHQRRSSLVQEEPQPPHIKEEPEEEADVSLLTLLHWETSCDTLSGKSNKISLHRF